MQDLSSGDVQNDAILWEKDCCLDWQSVLMPPVSGAAIQSSSIKEASTDLTVETSL
jgi:hypothetical protein